MVKKKKRKEKRRGDRRRIDRRRARRRLKKEPAKKNRRAPVARRAADRRKSLRRRGDTFLGKIIEFKSILKPGEVLPPLEEEVVTDAREIADGFVPSASEDAPESTDPAPESESN